MRLFSLTLLWWLHACWMIWFRLLAAINKFECIREFFVVHKLRARWFVPVVGVMCPRGLAPFPFWKDICFFLSVIQRMNLNLVEIEHQSGFVCSIPSRQALSIEELSAHTQKRLFGKGTSTFCGKCYMLDWDKCAVGLAWHCQTEGNKQRRYSPRDWHTHTSAGTSRGLAASESVNGWWKKCAPTTLDWSMAMDCLWEPRVFDLKMNSIHYFIHPSIHPAHPRWEWEAVWLWWNGFKIVWVCVWIQGTFFFLCVIGQKQWAVCGCRCCCCCLLQMERTGMLYTCLDAHLGGGHSALGTMLAHER